MISVGAKFDEVEVAEKLVNKVVSMFNNSYIVKGYKVASNNNVYVLLYDCNIGLTSRYHIRDVVKYATVECNTMLSSIV